MQNDYGELSQVKYYNKRQVHSKKSPILKNNELAGDVEGKFIKKTLTQKRKMKVPS